MPPIILARSGKYIKLATHTHGEAWINLDHVVLIYDDKLASIYTIAVATTSGVVHCVKPEGKTADDLMAEINAA